MQTNICTKFLQVSVATQDKHIEFKEGVLQEVVDDPLYIKVLFARNYFLIDYYKLTCKPFCFKYCFTSLMLNMR